MYYRKITKFEGEDAFLDFLSFTASETATTLVETDRKWREPRKCNREQRRNFSADPRKDVLGVKHLIESNMGFSLDLKLRGCMIFGATREEDMIVGKEYENGE